MGKRETGGGSEEGAREGGGKERGTWRMWGTRSSTLFKAPVNLGISKMDFRPKREKKEKKKTKKGTRKKGEPNVQGVESQSCQLDSDCMSGSVCEVDKTTKVAICDPATGRSSTAFAAKCVRFCTSSRAAALMALFSGRSLPRLVLFIVLPALLDSVRSFLVVPYPASYCIP